MSHDVQAPGPPNPAKTQPPLRFPLFFKLIMGFVVIMLFMILANVVVLITLEPFFDPEQTEFREMELAQDIGRTFGAVRESGLRYLQSGDQKDLRTFATLADKFRRDRDTLRALSEKPEIVAALDSLAALSDRFMAIFTEVPDRPSRDEIVVISRDGTALFERARTHLGTVREYYIVSVLKSWKTLNVRASNSQSAAYLILGLSMVVGIALGILMARTLTRPIQALKSGSQKVGEGLYEVVPVTSNDEVADLTVAFNLMSAKLRRLDEMRMELMSEISHEMRTPLQVIKAGCYSILHAKEAAPLVPKQTDAVAMIHQATNRINRFVNSFLDIAKLEAGLMKFNFENTDLVELLSPLVQEARLIAQTRHITLDYVPAGALLMKLDKDKMGQVFSNLLSNALKYTPDAGTIRVSVRTVERDGASGASPAANGRNQVRIDVADSGVGIPPEDVGKLFGKFFQAKNVPHVKEKGSGLGLALVKHVTEAHGGQVSVESAVGTGSTFSVFLPLN